MGEPQGIWLDNTEWTFDFPSDRKQFGQLVHAINTAVHSIERLFHNERIDNFTPRYEYQILFDDQNPIAPETGDYLKPIAPEHQQYFSDELKYDVWLPLYQIQGKNYWTCYFDQDDPTHWDVSCQMLSKQLALDVSYHCS